MQEINKAFNDSVAYYDSWVRKAVPGYDDLFGIAAELLPFPPEAEIRVLDLGAGTGLFAETVRRKYPEATFELWDLAEKMLEVARSRFAGSNRFRYVVGDYRELGGEGKFDLVISSLSIHHLDDEGKRELFARIWRALKADGCFLNIDQIRGATPTLQEMYCRVWEEKTRAAGATEAELAAGKERRRLFDREATLADQIRWLEEAGFADADCIYKNYLMGLFLAVKRP